MWAVKAIKTAPGVNSWCVLLQSKPLNVEYLMMDASILLPPTGTPLTGIDFVKRLPCGDVEKTRRVCEHTHMCNKLIKKRQITKINFNWLDVCIWMRFLLSSHRRFVCSSCWGLCRFTFRKSQRPNFLWPDRQTSSRRMMFWTSVRRTITVVMSKPLLVDRGHLLMRNGQTCTELTGDPHEKERYTTGLLRPPELCDIFLYSSQQYYKSYPIVILFLFSSSRG